MQLGRRKWSVRIVIVALAVIAGFAAVTVLRDDDDDPVAQTQSAGHVPPEVLSGPGTQLPGGMQVAPGSSLIGPPLIDELDPSGKPEDWTAVLLVDGDPIEVWTAYAEQISTLFPEDQIDAAKAPGCSAPDQGYQICSLEADTVTDKGWTSASAELVSVAGDITGSYLLVLDIYTIDTAPDSDMHEGSDIPPWNGVALPDPEPPRKPPAVGEPLAPHTTAYEGDNDVYVLLADSELLAQYGEASITGGFSVLLRVPAGADLDAVAAAYTKQANQFEGEPVDPPTELRYQDMTIKNYQPPGGAGGYSATIITVARPDGDGFIFYELSND